MPDLFSSQKESTPPYQPIVESDLPSQKKQTSTSHKTITTKENHFHALSSFCQNPSFLSLQGRDITSDTKLFLQRHVITNVPWIIVTIGLIFIPLLLQILFRLTNTSLSALSESFVFIFSLFYYLTVATYAFLNFINWFYNIIIVTTKDIVDVDFSDVIFHDVAATNVNLIEDVRYTQTGFIQGLFNFGDLFVQTAGGMENIEALRIPKPAQVNRFILDHIGKGELGG